MIGKHTDDVLRAGAVEVARVLDCLPVGIRARVIALQLNDDQLSVHIYC